jgi:hypothetical protein
MANANDGDVITFAIAGTITNLTGELLIDKNLDIAGPGPNALAVSGNNSSRVFNIAGGVTVNLSGLTICNGHAADGAAGTNSVTPGDPGNDGGGIYNWGTLALTNCVITRCRSGQGGAGFSTTGFPVGVTPGSSDGGSGGNGGGMYNAGTLMLVNCSLSTNAAGSGGSGGTPLNGGLSGSTGGLGGSGGGVYDVGTLTVIGSTLAFNSAGAGGAGGRGGAASGTPADGGGGGWGGDGGSGGALYSQDSPAFTSCTFAGNTAGAGGSGALGGAGYASLRLTSGNGGPGGDGGDGGSGGLYCLGAFQSVACTITGNAAGTGGSGGQGGAGAFASHGTGGNGGNGGNGGSGGGGGGASTWGGASLQNVLVAQNLAAAGGLAGAGGAAGPGLLGSGYPGSPGSGGTDGSGPDLLGAFTSNGYNLIGLDDGNTGFTDGVLGDIVGSGTPLNPLLGPLAYNGGPTFTCALLAGSPALDTGDDTLLGLPLSLTTDQRGLPRESGSHVDIGAFELQWASTPLRLAACARTANGAIQMTLTNVPGASLTLLAATNTSLPLSNWTVLGSVPEIAPGQFRFIDSASTNLPQRFYRLRCP